MMDESGTIAIIAIIAAIIFNLIGWHYKSKNYRASMLLKVFDELSTDDARKKREKVYDFFCKYKMASTEKIQYVDYDKPIDEIKEEKFKDIRDIANSVELSMERVCLLVKKKYANEKEIKELYGEMIVKSWKALRYDIEIHQGPNREKYAIYFDTLAKEYHDDTENPIDPEIDCTKEK